MKKHQMRPKNHGIHHQHLFRDSGKYPHGNQYLQHLVDAEKNAGLRKWIPFTFEINPERFRDDPCQREQNCRAAECDEILCLNGQIRYMCSENQPPYHNRSENEVNPFFLTNCAVLM